MSSPGNVQLTAEQRARIEQNRRQALERLKARNLKPQISSHSENVLKILPSKAVASSHRVNPYLKPSSSANNNKPFTAAINQTKIHSTKQELISKPAVSTVKTIQCTCEGTSETRFTVKTNGYDDRVIQEFKKIPSKIYRKILLPLMLIFHSPDTKSFQMVPHELGPSTTSITISC